MTSMIDNLKGKYFKCLKHGFVSLVDIMGDDEAVEQAARVSYQKGTRKVNDTRNLLRYCMSHRHTSIFEQVVLKFHIKAPIFVFRQWHRHRTWSYNEVSGRYSVLPDEVEYTEPFEWRTQSQTNKQGSGGFLEVNDDTDKCGMSLSKQEKALNLINRSAYDLRLEAGVAREQARKDLPVSQYSEMFATVNLHNLFHFLGLRSDSHAQKEIRDYSNIMAGIVKEVTPLSFEAWYDYAFQAVNFSRLDRELLNWMHENTYFDSMDGFGVSERGEELGMSKRELNEFWQKISVPDPVDFNLDMSQAVEYEELQKND